MVLDKLKQIVSSASAPSEQHTQRNGLFSHKAETHAGVWGGGLGLLSVLTAVYAPGYTSGVVAVAASLVVYALGEREAEVKDTQIPREVIDEARREPQYLLGCFIGGVVLGVLVVWVLGVLA